MACYFVMQKSEKQRLDISLQHFILLNEMEFLVKSNIQIGSKLAKLWPS